VHIKTKLTLSILKENVRKAKAYAKKHNTSLSEQVDKMLEDLVNRPADYGKPRQQWLKALVGKPIAIGKSYQQLKDEFYGEARLAKK
jgi:hypothetical protein